MKKVNKFLMVLCAVLVLTGCTPKALKNAYSKMEVGTSKSQINGYTASIRLFGLYKDKKINQSIRVQNYQNKDYKVVDSSSDVEKTYYIIDGVNYKSVVKTSTTSSSKDTTTSIFGSSNSSVTYEKTTSKVPFTNTNLYLTSLKSAKNTGDAKSETIGDLKYTTYEYTVSKKVMSTILADTTLKKIEFTADIPAKVWIDKDGYVYKVEYDLATGIKSDSTLSLNVYYNSVNNSSAISIQELGLSTK